MAPAREPTELLVLGGSGFLGAHVVDAALRVREAGGAVACASRAPCPAAWAGEWERAVRLRALDALRPGALERALDELAPARVVNCAALARLDRCAAEPELARALNADLPARLARWCAARGARLVHVSTDLVFGARAPGPEGFGEADEPGPLSEYGRTKRGGEEAVLAAWAAALIVRLPLLYGDSRGRGLGASDSLLAALARGERPALFTDELRTPLDAYDAAAALVELARGGARGVLHLAGPERLSRHELGLRVLAARGVDGAGRVRATTRAAAGLAAQRPADVCLDARRARALLATPLLAVDAALARDSAPRRA